ncbi:O-antigen ligase family protein [Methylocapsa palsarum]|nr:O-antigen ligase family protein [Methylocapsa palsarum]
MNVDLTSPGALPDDDAEAGPLNAGLAKLPLLPALLVVAVLLPEELYLQVGGLFLTLPRVLLLVAFPLLLVRTIRQATRPGFHASISDYAIFPLSIWMFLAVAVSQGFTRAMVGSSALILDFAGSYLVMRTIANEPGAAVAVARFMAGALAVAALLGPLDHLFGQYAIHRIGDMLTHLGRDLDPEFRHGLMRARGAQEHSILLGSISSFGAILSLSVFRGVPRWIAVICCLAGLFSAVSSAPILATLMGFGLLFFRRQTPHFPSRWLALGVTGGSVALLVFTLHPSPFAFIFQHFTLDPQTSWYRLVIWQVAGSLVLANPLFGIGLDDWAREAWMPSTVDSVWLRSAMMFGIVGSALIAVVVIGACSRPLRVSGREELPLAEQSLGVGLGIITFLIAYLGFTVHFWGCTWFMMGMFAGLRAHLGGLAADQPSLDDLDFTFADDEDA